MLHRLAAASFFFAACFLLTSTASAQQSEAPLVPLAGATAAEAGNLAPQDAAISGIVLTQDGHPLQDAGIEIKDTSTGAMVAFGYTGPSGTFELRNLPRGIYQVVATSGLSEAQQEIHLDGLESSVNLRMPHTTGADAGNPGQKTVSVAQMQVPDKARSEFRKAREEVQKNKMDEARKHIEKALAIYPMYSDALTIRAVLHLNDGNTAAALDDLQHAINYDNNNALAYTAMGAVYNTVGKFDYAIRELDRSISLNPASWQTYFELAKAQLGKDAFGPALSAANRAESLIRKDYAPVYLIKGQALLGLKNYPEAIATFQKYLDHETDASAAAEVRQQLEHVKSFVATAQKQP